MISIKSIKPLPVTPVTPKAFGRLLRAWGKGGIREEKYKRQYVTYDGDWWLVADNRHGCFYTEEFRTAQSVLMYLCGILSVEDILRLERAILASRSDTLTIVPSRRKRSS